MTNGPTPATLELLREGKIDFGVVSGPLVQTQSVHTVSVKQVEDVFVAGKRFAGYFGGTHPLGLLEKLPLIMLDGQTSTGKYVRGFLEKNGVTVSPEFELATSDMIVQFALRNLGVGSVMREFAREELERGTLQELHFDVQIPKRDFVVVTDGKETGSLAAAKLLEMIAACCGRTKEEA